MHNIFLGTACKMMKLWTIETNLISKNQLVSIQNIVDNNPLPSNIGRIPHKIASSFSGFTSDQWKTWTLIYSTMVLKDILPIYDQKIWAYFANAVSIMS